MAPKPQNPSCVFYLFISRMTEIRVQFVINFQKLQLIDFPDTFKNQRCYLRFVRNQNDLQTKKATIDSDGVAEFNEKIDMKTFIEKNMATN